MKYFPFAPNIPWYVKQDFIIPKMNADIFSRAIENKDICLVCYGGFFETYFSLSILELLNSIYLGKNFYWKGNLNFYKLVEINNLTCNDKAPIIEKKHLRNYPIPLFFDRENFVYFNCLNDYVTKISLTEFKRKLNSGPITKQLFLNSFNNWNIKYKPKMRLLKETKSFKSWSAANNFNLTNKYVLIFPDRIGWSIHNCSNLKWNINHIRSLSAMLSLHGYKTIVVTNHKNYNNHNIISINPDIENIMLLMNNAKAILSEEVDFSLVALLNSSAKIIGLDSDSIFNLYLNNIYLNTTNELFLQKELKVIDVFNAIVN